jgi:hypothetical protein
MIARQLQSVSCSAFVSPCAGRSHRATTLGRTQRRVNLQKADFTTVHQQTTLLVHSVFGTYTVALIHTASHPKKELAGRDQKDHRQPVPANVMQRKNPRLKGGRHVMHPWRTMVWSNCLKSQFLSTLLTALCSPASVCTASAQKPGSPYPWGRPHHLLLCHSFPCVLRLRSPHP